MSVSSPPVKSHTHTHIQTKTSSESVLIFIQGEDTQVLTSKSIFGAETSVSTFADAGILPAASIRVSGGTEIKKKHLAIKWV